MPALAVATSAGVSYEVATAGVRAANCGHDARLLYGGLVGGELRRVLDEKSMVTFVGSGKTYDKEDFIRMMTAGDVDPTVSQKRTTR
jgi:phage head maturation protease